jgi:SAM-dependent methyltransferase
LIFGAVALKRRRSRGLSARKIEPYRLPDDAPPWVHAVERVAARYSPPDGATPAQRTRFHYVRLKLLGDPIARMIADIAGGEPGVLGEVLDIGTGAGQLPILLLELGRARRVRGFDWDRAKVDDALRARDGIAAVSGGVAPAEMASGGSSGELRSPSTAPRLDAELWCADAREAELGEADTVLLIDLLHYVRVEEQDAILRRAAAAVRPRGRLLLREADTEQGWRSSVTLLEERVFTALRFNRGERVRFRPARELVALLSGLGFSCEILPAWGKTPFSNVLIVATRRP